MKQNLKVLIIMMLCINAQHNLATSEPKIEIGSSLELFNYQDTPVKLSILIATIEKRADLFDKLYTKLIDQLKSFNLEQVVEVAYFKDNQIVTLGYKRNALIHKAKGEYVCFLDDDDGVCEDYTKLLYDACCQGADCVSCTGILYLNGFKRRTFVHSLKYTTAFTKNGIAYSPVYHLNPVKRNLAIQIPYPDQNFNEDGIWVKKMMASGLLKTEYEVTKPYYFYYYNPSKSQAVPKAKKQIQTKSIATKIKK
jgi:hypothetical protein